MLISQLEDDTTIFLKNEQQIPITLQKIQRFSKASGLTLNLNKCELFALHDTPLKELCQVPIKSEMKYLSIHLTKDQRRSRLINVKSKLTECKTKLNSLVETYCPPWWRMSLLLSVSWPTFASAFVLSRGNVSTIYSWQINDSTVTPAWLCMTNTSSPALPQLPSLTWTCSPWSLSCPNTCQQCGPTGYTSGPCLSGLSCRLLASPWRDCSSTQLWRSWDCASTCSSLRLHPDIDFQPRRRYIHRGSRRSFRVDSSNTIKSIWSNSRRSSPNTGRVANHSVLTSQARSAYTAAKFDTTTFNFGLLNIHSLTSKGHLIQDLLSDRKFDFICLTETWQ